MFLFFFGSGAMQYMQQKFEHPKETRSNGLCWTDMSLNEWRSELTSAWIQLGRPHMFLGSLYMSRFQQCNLLPMFETCCMSTHAELRMQLGVKMTFISGKPGTACRSKVPIVPSWTVRVIRFYHDMLNFCKPCHNQLIHAAKIDMICP